MPTSRPDSQVFTDVHVYFHPANADTKYTGTIRVAFLEGTTPYELKADVIVKRGDDPAHQSVIGMVSSVPGVLDLTIAIDAEGETTRQIRERVRVTLDARAGYLLGVAVGMALGSHAFGGVSG